MRATEYIQGDLIGGIEFIREIDPHISPSRKTRMALFKCYCGIEFDCMIRSVISGNTSSCGCYGRKSRSERFSSHGKSNHKFYSVWCGIKSRCYNHNRDDYKYYGGRGVKLSDEFSDFKCFFDYVSRLDNSENVELLGLTVDRIDVNGDYTKGNLRWATRSEQAKNRR